MRIWISLPLVGGYITRKALMSSAVHYHHPKEKKEKKREKKITISLLEGRLPTALKVLVTHSRRKKKQLAEGVLHNKDGQIPQNAPWHARTIPYVNYGGDSDKGRGAKPFYDAIP